MIMRIGKRNRLTEFKDELMESINGLLQNVLMDGLFN